MADDSGFGRSGRVNEQRRLALRGLGAGALGMLAASSLSRRANAATPAAVAQLPTTTNTLAGMPQTTPLSRLSASQIQALRLTTRQPGTTPITKLGLTTAGVSLLTPAAAKLTKADLESLAAGQIAGADADLTVADLQSISAAFGKEYRPITGGWTISCCSSSSCPCCCCAAAVRTPPALAA
jgi:hypothetical protein